MVSEVIRKFRKTHNLTMDALATAISDELRERTLPPTFVTKQSVSLWETGKMQPNALMFEWLADNAKSDMVAVFAKAVMDELNVFHGEGVA